MSQRLKKVLLLGGDIVVLYVSLWLTLLIRYQVLPDSERWLQHFWPFTVVYVIWLVVFYINGLYSITITRNDFKFFTSLGQAMLANASLGAIFFYLTPFVGISPKTNFIISLVLGFAMVALWRQLVNIFIGAKGRRMKTLLIGESSQLDELTKFLNSHPQLGYKVAKTISPTEVLNSPDFDLKKLIEQHQIKVVAAENIALRSQTMVDQLFKIIPLKLKVLDLANFAEEVSGKIPISSIGQVWFLENLNLASQNTYELAKRAFDVFVSVFLLIVLSWLIPLIVLAILISMGRPVVFKQKRTGQLGNSFQAMKFRSMVQDAEKSGPQWAQKDDPRVTGLGKFLRKTRLDEIPQLFNVIWGEMSFVGPRPERPVFVETLREKIQFYNERHLVKPGLTGWAQINFPYGASEADALEKLQYDLYYVKNRSLVFDLSIILKTIKTILSASGQ
jgi:sugar transferase (PEP-CTERM system associated)